MKRLMWLVLAVAVASVAYGQDDPNNAAEPLQRHEVPKTKLSIGFPPGWDIEEKDDKIVATSPDEKCRILAVFVPKPDPDEDDSEGSDAEFKMVQKAVSDYLKKLNSIKKSTFRRVPEWMGAIYSGRSTAKTKDGDEVEYLGDTVVMQPNITVVVIAYGSKEEKVLENYEAEIKRTRASYEKADD